MVDNVEEKAKSSENDEKELMEIKEAFEQRIQEVSGETEEVCPHFPWAIFRSVALVNS